MLLLRNVSSLADERLHKQRWKIYHELQTLTSRHHPLCSWFFKEGHFVLPSAYPKENMAGVLAHRTLFLQKDCSDPRFCLELSKSQNQSGHSSLHSIHVLRASYIPASSNTFLFQSSRERYIQYFIGKKCTAKSLGKDSGGIKITYVLLRLARILSPCQVLQNLWGKMSFHCG